MSAATAFDAVAAGYDDRFTRSRIGQRMRDTVRAHLAGAFRPGDRVLELGCGTGEDALWLADRGVNVTATDASERMLAIAREKAAAAGRTAHASVAFERLDLNEVADTGSDGAELDGPSSGGASSDAASGSIRIERRAPPGAPFDGAFSNFGVLNCVADRRAVFRFAAERVRPGGRLVIVLMGPLCPWEIGWHLATLRPRSAVRRLRAGAAVELGAGSVRVWYPSPGRVRAEAAPWFVAEAAAGIGAFLPPPYLERLAERWPRCLDFLARMDARWAGRPPWTWLNDHYLLVLRR